MENTGLQLLNIFFFVLHTALIVFNIFGWLLRRTRRLHFYSLLITLFSWGVLGIWKGFGYCFLTDWHYDVLYQMGTTDLPNSYIAFLIESLTGWMPNATLVNISTLVLTLLALVCSVLVNFTRLNKEKSN